jgi:zinc protease
MLAFLLPIVALLPITVATPEFHRLDSGLRVAIVEDHTLPLVSVQLWFAVGSAGDDAGNPGLCHVARTILENRHDAALRLRAAGVRCESRTLRDACYFASTCPPGWLEHVLDIEAERLRPTAVTAEELARGLNAAARDYGLEPNSPTQAAERRLLAALFPGHPYAHPPNFVAQSSRDLSPAQRGEFMQRCFAATNMVLLIVGDVRRDDALDLVRKRFGGLPRAESPGREDLTLPKSESVHLPPSLADCPGLDIAWATLPASAAENGALDVLMQRLCNPVDGALYRRLVAAGCLPPQWRREAWREGGLLMLTVDCLQVGTKEPAEQIEQIVREELERAEEGLPTETELNRARALAARAWQLARANFAERALDLGWHELVAGDILRAELELPYITHLAVADLRRAAGDLRHARAIYRPRIAAGDNTRPAMSQPSPALPRALSATPPAQLDTSAALELLATHVKDAPAVTSPRSPARLSTARISDRVKLTLCVVPGLEPVTVRTLLRLRRPHRYLPAILLSVGSTQRSVEQYREYLSYHGLDLFPLGDLSRPGLDSRGPATRVPQMIELQADLIRRPDGSDAALEAGFEALQRVLTLRAAPPLTPLEDTAYLPPGLIGWSESGRFLPQIVDQLSAVLASLAAIEDVEVLIVGDVSPAPAIEATRAAWRDWTPPATASAPTTLPGSASSPAPLATDRRFATSAAWVIAEDESLTLHVADTLWPTPLEQPLRDLAEQTATWLLGVPWHVSSEIDVDRVWFWTCGWVESNWVDAAAQPTSGDLVPPIEAYVRQAGRALAGRTPPEQLAVALRQARADRLLALDGSAAIAELIERGVSNPWDVLDSRRAADFAELVAQAYSVRERSIVGSGPEDHAADLKRFETVPDDRDQPRSP